MPITQDRLIRLIDITSRTLEWANKVKTLSETHAISIIEVTNAIQDETDLARLKYGLSIIKTKAINISDLFHDLPLSQADSLALGREQGHFNATSVRNKKSRDRMKFVRADKIDQSMTEISKALSPEHIAEVDAELSRLWHSLPPSPASEPISEPDTSNRPPGDSDELNLPAPRANGKAQG